jgi:hypothetical protein
LEDDDDEAISNDTCSYFFRRTCVFLGKI